MKIIIKKASLILLFLMLLNNCVTLAQSITIPVNQTPLVDFDTLVQINAQILKDSIIEDTLIQTVVNSGTGSATASSIDTTSRTVFFVHGLGGEIGSWNMAKQAVENGVPSKAFPSYKIQGIQPRFTGNVSYESANMRSAGINLLEAMQKEYFGANAYNQEKITNQFIIAHSQGGIVSRTSDWYINNFSTTSTYQRCFKGIVTFGTPNQGARILNNVAKLTKLVSEGSSDLAAGPSKENAYYVSIFLPNLYQKFIDTLVPKITTKLIDFGFSSFTTPITNAFKEGAKHLSDTLAPNEPITLTHKAAIYGVEEEPILWRTMNWFILQKPNNINEFEANVDTAMVNRVTKFINYYKLKYTIYDDESKYSLNPLKRKRARAICKEYLKGLHWLRNVNDAYKLNMGALELTPVLQCYETCKLVPKNFFMGLVFPSISLGSSIKPNDGVNCTSYKSTTTASFPVYNKVCNAFPFITLIKTERPSDGVVTAYSAANYPNMVYPPYRIDGSNHQQMRNDEGTRRALLELLEIKSPIYNHVLDPWFNTNHK